jgi:TrmH family RNA methyltransferase
MPSAAPRWTISRSPIRLKVVESISNFDFDLLRDSLVRDDLVFLDGFHAIKHARFGAEFELVACADFAKFRSLASDLDPSLGERLGSTLKSIRWGEAEKIGPGRAHWTGVWGVARKPTYSVTEILNSRKPVILLERPENLGNLGACIRVAAAAGVGGVLVTGADMLWAPAVVRSAAGLQFSLPVAPLADIPVTTRPIIAMDPNGEDASSVVIPEAAIFAFGSERHGLSSQIDELAVARIRIPMKTGVSSLNIAVAVGIVLYTFMK